MPTGEPGEHLPGQLSGEQSKTALFSGFVRGSLISSRARWGVGICDNLGGFRGSIRRRPGAAVPPPLPVNISPISRQNPTNLTGCQTSKIPTTKNPNRENCPACEKLGVLWVCRGIARGKKTRPRPVGPWVSLAAGRAGRRRPLLGDYLNGTEKAITPRQIVIQLHSLRLPFSSSEILIYRPRLRRPILRGGKSELSATFPRFVGGFHFGKRRPLWLFGFSENP